MDALNTSLQTLGLTQEEIHLYFTTLEQGSVSVLELARATKIPRTTVYLLIDSLREKGLLKLTVAGKKKRYISAAPREIITFARNKQKQLEQSISQLEEEIPQLEAVYRTTHSSPQIQYYKGVEEVKKIYEQSLEVDKIFVHCISQSAMEIMGAYLNKYFVRVTRRMIHTQEIVSDSAGDKAYQQEFSTSRNQIICIPASLGSNTDYMIYGDKVAFITYRSRQPVGVVIFDKEIAHFEKIRFQMIWEKYNSKL